MPTPHPLTGRVRAVISTGCQGRLTIYSAYFNQIYELCTMQLLQMDKRNGRVDKANPQVLHLPLTPSPSRPVLPSLPPSATPPRLRELHGEKWCPFHHVQS